ncbi:MAG TPA: SpoIID/LytB domain-containing protein [bacterium]|nr:SpoIID/LytB domain-containing protein [bacterium]
MSRVVRPRRAILAGTLAGAVACFAAASPPFGCLLPARGTESLVIRVGVLVDRPSVQISADGPVTAEDVSVSMFTAPAPVVLAQPPGGTAWIATASGNAGLDLSGTLLGPAVRLTAQHGLLRADGRSYRGTLELRRTPAGRVTVVNVLDLESYLYGVIKGEVDPRWPPEAVRAQAVAARTLAVQRMLASVSAQDPGSAAAGFDLAATTDAQVYLGAAAEDPAATSAVDATRGLVVTYDGRPIFAAYHSNSGGHTEDSENVWGTLYPYLRGVPDPYALDAPGVTWSTVLPLAAIEADLRRGGASLTGLDDVAPGRVTPWGRVVTVRVRGEDGRTQEINANRFRLLVGPSVLRSTMFSVARRGLAADFTGRGSGHGVGLDQWGARAMAARGSTFEQILKYYYTGVTIEPRY